MTDKIVVFSTCSTHEEAARIARKLVAEHLAACVNVAPGVRSFYRWKGAIEEADEFLLVTQNVDDLHERAGLAKAEMVQIHGDIFVTKCSR